ncbi:family M22 non-peptidase [Croceitalea dokdonensis DOKDO 023]|uniref:Family M22 non-peptidase n=1 Tax=Croceitalea dokdonensis DOKDO 023 TaxID=1300341 RepID=A0A0P7AHY7_9FLAO|nr:tRNA (adenosine(37)-N6)-threonylcarbamoyltransferase complex dimerization subunit type 1 TsaB [Croceitalea dokdonensis]KPM31375.1 family M22 non-peptidase [Croceitalea dokdonensis DOKDO 023]
MAVILNLETATTNCSVSIAINGSTIALKEENTPNYSHSEQLHLFIQKAVAEAGITMESLDAIAVSKGPGSYTGLRIGVSAAKGLCFALEKPLISVPTLQSMALQIQAANNELIIPVLDARRMEVYSCVFGSNHKEIQETKAEVVTTTSFADWDNYDRIHLVGSGAGKCKALLTDERFVFWEKVVPSAKEMATLSFGKYQQQEFEDVAYFEPFYLKDFVMQRKKA